MGRVFKSGYLTYLNDVDSRSRITSVASARHRLVYTAMANRARPGRSAPKLFAVSGESLNQSSLGLTFAFSVLIGFAIGFGLDRLFHTRPWLMLVFTALGLAAGFVNLVRAARLGR